MRTFHSLTIFLGVFWSCVFGALNNNAEFVNLDFHERPIVHMQRLDGTGREPVVFHRASGHDGKAPAIENGTLLVSLAGATGGMTQLSTGDLTEYMFSEAEAYIVTTRMRVNQFPEAAFDPGAGNTSSGINILDIRSQDRAWIALQPDAVWVRHGRAWVKAAEIETLENHFYTWQFEISPSAGEAPGTVRILRRENDSDPWSVLADGVSLHAQRATPQIQMFRIYHAANTEIQGVLEVDTLSIGVHGESVHERQTVETDPVLSESFADAAPSEWILPGTTFGEIANAVAVFDDRIRNTILREATFINADRDLLPVSLDDRGLFFDPGDVSIDVFPSEKREGPGVLVSRIFPYVTRYVPPLLREKRSLDPVWESELRLDPDSGLTLNPGAMESGVYRLHLILQNSRGDQVAERRIYFAVTYDGSPLVTPAAPAVLPDHRPLLTQYYPMDVGINFPEVGVSNQPDIDFPILKAAGYDGIRIIVHWDDLEVIPGGYHFQRLDEIVKKAGQYGLNVAFFPIYQAHRIPMWLMAEDFMVDQDGEVARSEGTRFRMVPNLFSEAANRGYRDLIGQLINRYDSLPHVVGYHLAVRAVEWGFAGAMFREQTFDYSETSRQRFRTFLQDQGHTLESLSERYGQSFNRWQDIDLPRPRFFETDPSFKWNDFNEFKLYGLRYVAQPLLSSTRARTDKLITLYNYGGFGPVENLFDLLERYDAFGGICSAQTFYMHVVNDMYRRSGLRMYIEPAGLDPNRPEGALFSKLHAGQLLHEAGGIVNFPNPPMTVPTKKHFDSMIHVLDHAFNTRPDPRIGIHVSYRSIIDHAKSFTGNFYWDWRFYKSFIFGLQYTGATVEYFTDFTDHDIDKYDLVIDAASQLISDRDVERLRAYVANGGKLVLFPESGRYVLGQETPSHFAARMGLDGLQFEGNKHDTILDWNGYAAQFNDGYVLRHNDFWTPVLKRNTGETLVAHRAHGKGSVMVLGGYPSLQRRWRGTEFAVQNVSFFKALLSETGLLDSEPLLALEARPVRSMIFAKGEDLFLALVNDNREELDVRYRINAVSNAEGTDLVSGRTVEISNHILNTQIDPHALMVIQFQGGLND